MPDPPDLVNMKAVGLDGDNTYVGRAMNLLLLLSALLSALTGVNSSARAAQAPAVSQSAAAAAAVAAVRKVRLTDRPAPVLPTIAAVSGNDVIRRAAPHPTEQAYASRRRE